MAAEFEKIRAVAPFPVLYFEMHLQTIRDEETPKSTKDTVLNNIETTVKHWVRFCFGSCPKMAN